MKKRKKRLRIRKISINTGSTRGEDYVNYRVWRRETNRKIKEAKNESSERFRESLVENKRLANRAFYKVVRSMRKRNANHNIREIINDKNGSPLIESSNVTEIWKKYFNKLLN